MIYLDNAASTRCDDSVVDAMLPYYTERYGNPGNITNRYGSIAESAVITARNNVAENLKCFSQEIIWTSGATEANNISINGIIHRLRRLQPARNLHIVVSSIEHKSVGEPVMQLKLNNVDVTFIRPNKDGYTSSRQLLNEIKDSTVLVCLMLANNETGIINEVAEVAEFCESRRVWFHCDATQAFGKVPVDLKKLRVSSLSFSGHKFHGPKGVGVLFVRNHELLDPIVFGGGQENGLRSGTLNVPGIVGLSKALTLAFERSEEDMAKIVVLRDRLEANLTNYDERIKVNGVRCSRLPNISNISFPVRAGYNMMEQITDYGILACSSGSACDTADNRPSHVLKELGKSRHEAKNTLRFSLSRYTSFQEIEDAANHLIDLFRKGKA